MSNYTRVEYLQSTGTQYIDTGVQYNSTLGYQLKISGLQYTQQGTGIIGTDGWLYSLTIVTGNRLLWTPVSNKKYAYSNINANDIYEVSCGVDYYTVNGNSITAESDAGNTGSGSITVFKARGLTERIKLYYLKVFDNNTLIRDFIPVLDGNNTPCLYDKVSETFFYNSGSGDFIAGNPISTGFQYYRLTITDFRRNGGSSKQIFASCGELKFYDANGNEISNSGGIFSASTYAQASESPDKAFDGNINTMWHSVWSGSQTSTTNWLQIQFPQPKEVRSFGFTPHNQYSYQDFPYTMRFSASNDGSSWHDLIEFTGLSTGWAKGVERVFSVPKGYVEAYIRLRIKKIRTQATWSSTPVGQLGELYIYDKDGNQIGWLSAVATANAETKWSGQTPQKAIDYLLGESNKWAFIPTYTSGSECDVSLYISGIHFDPSDIGYYSFATAYDNSERDPVSWELYIGTSALDARLVDSQTDYSVPTSRQTEITRIAVEYSTSEKKYLIKSGSTLYTVENGALVALSETVVTSTLFSESGFDTLPTGSILSTLTDPELMFWDEDDEATLPTITASMTAAPPSQTLTATPMTIPNNFSGIQQCIVSSAGSPKIALKFDSGDFEYYNGTDWVTAGATDGMTPTVMLAIAAADWTTKFQNHTSLTIRVILDTINDKISLIRFKFAT